MAASVAYIGTLFTRNGASPLHLVPQLLTIVPPLFTPTSSPSVILFPFSPFLTHKIRPRASLCRLGPAAFLRLQRVCSRYAFRRHEFAAVEVRELLPAGQQGVVVEGEEILFAPHPWGREPVS